jgi:hypothetical protein
VTPSSNAKDASFEATRSAWEALSTVVAYWSHAAAWSEMLWAFFIACW